VLVLVNREPSMHLSYDGTSYNLRVSSNHTSFDNTVDHLTICIQLRPDISDDSQTYPDPDFGISLPPYDQITPLNAQITTQNGTYCGALNSTDLQSDTAFFPILRVSDWQSRKLITFTSVLL